MGLLSKIKDALGGQQVTYELPEVPPTEPTVRLPRHVEVVGETYYLDEIRRVTDGVDKIETVAVLLPEPENPHDNKAVAVYVKGAKIGHLARGDNTSLLPTIRKALKDSGVAAVSCRLATRGYAVLEPGQMPRFSAPAIIEALIDAGYWPRGDHAGFSVRQEGEKYRVFYAGASGGERDEAVPEMAKILRDAGFKARGARDGSGYPYVNVTDG